MISTTKRSGVLNILLAAMGVIVLLSMIVITKMTTGRRWCAIGGKTTGNMKR